MADNMLTIEDAPAARTRKRRSATEEDDSYLRKIEKLSNAMLKSIRDKELGLETHKSKETAKKRRKVPKKYLHTPVVINEVTERLNEFVTNELKGTELQLVIQKTLYYSDTLQTQNRLSIPVKQMENVEFLTTDETRILNNKENKIEVLLVGPTLEVYNKPMELTMWNMQSSVNYVLKSHWFEFWSENKECLREDSKIQVWSFRRDRQLCFAVVCVENPGGDQGVEEVKGEDEEDVVA
ncbi:putative B3 domain-containing protein At2g27410 [Bidens hawaiensis]|uniref:putative B3 domain-containing protein At2g27410 n=1 Tax=Bidens hawaiensis TaxID=980011 RepID=UPI00404AC2B9